MRSRFRKQSALLRSDYPETSRPNHPWGRAVSAFMVLPGIRAVWTGGLSDGVTPDLRDIAGLAQTLTRNGTPTLNLEGLAPYVDMATADYFSRASDANSAITGGETYIATARRGLSIGGWFYLDALQTGTRHILGKWGATLANQSYRLEHTSTGDLIFTIVDSAGTTQTSVTALSPIAAGSWFFAAGRFKDLEIAVWNNEEKTVQALASTTIRSNATAFTLGADSAGANGCDGRGSLMFLSAMNLPDYYFRAIYENTRRLFAV